MLPKLCIALLAVGAFGCKSRSPVSLYTIPKDHITVLMGDSGKSLCSMFEAELGGNPNIIQPSEPLLLAVQQELPEFIRIKRPTMFPKFYEYRFQVACAQNHGKTFLFINAFDESILAGRPEKRFQPIDVQDGGDSFWKITYSVEKKNFTRLSVNGSA